MSNKNSDPKVPVDPKDLGVVVIAEEDIEKVAAKVDPMVPVQPPEQVSRK